MLNRNLKQGAVHLNPKSYSRSMMVVRGGGGSLGRKVVVTVGALALSISTLAVGAASFSAEAAEAPRGVEPRAAHLGAQCQIPASSPQLAADLARISRSNCVFGDKTSSSKVLFVADSHGLSWLPAIDAIGKRNDWAVHTRIRSACWYASLAGFQRHPVGKKFLRCPQWNQLVRKALPGGVRYDAVIFARSQEQYEFTTSSPQPAVRNAQLHAQLVNAFRFYSKRTSDIIVVRDRAIGQTNVAACFAKYRNAAGCAPLRSAGLKYEARLAAREGVAARAAGVTAKVSLIPTADIFCAPRAIRCPIFGLGGKALFADRTHLPNAASLAAASRIGPRINATLGMSW